MAKRLADYADGEAEWAAGNLILFAHPGGGYVFGVADEPPGWVAWGDARIWVDVDDCLICPPAETDPAAGLLVGRRFATPEGAIAAAEPYELAPAAKA